jgi:hypothetical protein
MLGAEVTMKLLALLVLTVLVSGCVPGHTFAPGRYLDPSGSSPEAFARDRKACRGEGGIYAVPVILMPVLVAAMLANRESARRCMEKRGWRVVEESPTEPPTAHALELR